MNKVSLTLTSKLPAEDLEAMLEAVKPAIRQMSEPEPVEIHTDIIEDD